MRKEDFRSVLIFGGAGFIGSNWASWLLQNSSAKVHIFDNLSRPGVRHNLEWLQGLSGKSGRLQITTADIRESAKVERAARHATEIYHLAAQVAVTTSIREPRFDFDVNLAGTFNVLEAARRSGNRPFLLFTSTNKVYGNSHLSIGKKSGGPAPPGVNEDQPLDFHSPYGCSKGAADQYVRDYARIYSLRTAVFRMSCIAGPRQFGNEDQGWVAHFLYSALQGSPIAIYGDGRQVRDVLCVEDLLRAFEAARRLPASEEGRVYNIGGGPQNAVSLLGLISQVEHLTGRSVETSFDAPRPGDQPYYVTDYSRFQRDTGWVPAIDVRGTLARIHEFWKQNRDLFVARPSEAAIGAAAESGYPRVA